MNDMNCDVIGALSSTDNPKRASGADNSAYPKTSADLVQGIVDSQPESEPHDPTSVKNSAGGRRHASDPFCLDPTEILIRASQHQSSLPRILRSASSADFSYSPYSCGQLETEVLIKNVAGVYPDDEEVVFGDECHSVSERKIWIGNEPPLSPDLHEDGKSDISCTAKDVDDNAYNDTDQVEEKKSLIEREGGAGIHEAPDVLIVCMNPFYEHADEEDKFPINKMLRDCIVDHERFTGMMPKLFGLKSSKGTVRKKEVYEAVYHDLNSLMPKLGFEVAPFRSIDDVHIFLRVSITSQSLMEFYASKDKLKLQLSKDLVGALGIDLPLDEVTMPYVNYTDSLKNRKFVNPDGQEQTYQPFQLYYGENPDGSIFRRIDRVRAIYSAIESIIDIDDLVLFGVMKAHMPAHSRLRVYEFVRDWCNWKKFFSFTPLDRLRNYYGEQTAYEILWVEYTILMVIPLAIAGGISKFLQYRHQWNDEPEAFQVAREQQCLYFSLIVPIWLGLYLLFWKRTERRYQVRWGSTQTKWNEPIRPNFMGKYKPSDVDRNKNERQYPRWRQKLWCVCTSLVLVISCLFIFSIVLCIFESSDVVITWIRQRLPWLDSICEVLLSVTLAITIKTSNWLWGKAAPRLVEFENPRTMSEYKNSLIWKLFLFKFFGSYVEFLWIAFMMKYRTTRVCPRNDFIQMDNDCHGYLVFELYKTYTIFCGISILMTAVNQWKYNNIRDAENDAFQQKAAGRRPDGGIGDPPRSYMENQLRLEDRTEIKQCDDFVELMLNFGFISMFFAASPGIAIMAVIVLMIMLRLKGFGLLKFNRRLRPAQANGIGAWNQVLDFFCKSSLLCTAGLLIRYADLFDALDSWLAIADIQLTIFNEQREQMVLGFFIAENIALMLFIMARYSLPETPHDVEVMEKRQNHIIDKLYICKDVQFGEEQRASSKKSILVSVMKQVVGKPDVSQQPLRMDVFHPDWANVDNSLNKPKNLPGRPKNQYMIIA